MTNKILNLGKALSDLSRLRILMLLRGGELSASAIQKILDCNNSTLSHHLKTLTETGLIKRRREAKWHYFSLARRSEEPETFEWIKLIISGLSHDSQYSLDLKSLHHNYVK